MTDNEADLAARIAVLEHALIGAALSDLRVRVGIFAALDSPITPQRPSEALEDPRVELARLAFRTRYIERLEAAGYR